MLQTVSSIFPANLRALSISNPEAARAVEQSLEHPHFRPLIGDDGTVTGEVESPTGNAALSSRRQPAEEARRFAASVDLAKAAIIVVLGFGAGHHVRELARRVSGAGLVLVFEPDTALLRSVLSHVDHSPWLGSSNIRILTDPEDRAAMVEAVRGCEGLVGMGVKIIEHAPSKARLAAHRAVFTQRLTEVIDSTKLTVLTSLVQVRTTIRNATQNLDRYVTTPGVLDLKNACVGRPAVVVSAGPSLRRNVDLLSRPGVRDRVIIVAVQTVIKSLLERGIRPHFVTALDHSEISRRFYEGLTAADVEGITLVVEPKVNPAVLEAWPGAVRTAADPNLDRLLGDFAPNKGTLAAGATVAHLAYYLARHLGSNPVALIGQDLGFTDGQYYAPGAAIHEVWGGEVNEFNTLEMLEWQRILRMGSHLRRATDHLGRPMFTDEQMQAYLSQFERDFKRDKSEGRTTFDCTEGGVRKLHAEQCTLEEFLKTHAPSDAPQVTLPPLKIERPIALSKVTNQITHVRQSAWRLSELSRKAESLLIELIEHHDDQPRVNRLIGRLEVVTREVLGLEPAYSIAHIFAQTGAFNRVRADRLIHLDQALDAMGKQRRQAERDLANVRSLKDTADQLALLLESSLRTIAGEKRITHEVAVPQSEDVRDASKPPHRVLAIIPAFESLLQPGQVSPLQPASEECSLARTLEAVLRVPRVDEVVVVSDVAERVRSVMGALQEPTSRVQVLSHHPSDLQRFRARQTWVARAAAGACWRGGIANASCFDECFDPQLASQVLSQHRGDAALVLGACWEALDPALTSAVIERYLEDPDDLRFAFTQAIPGIAPCVLGRTLVESLATGADIGLLASVGALLGYSPRAPVNDLIASTRCVNIPVELRDAGVCAVADTAERRAAVREAQAIGSSAHLAWSSTFAQTLAGVSAPPNELVIDYECETALSHIDSFAHTQPGGLLTITIANDPQLTRLSQLLTHARTHPLCVHVQTRSLTEPLVKAMLTQAPDIISISLEGDCDETYKTMTGRDDFETQRTLLAQLLSARATPARPHGPMFVIPRITRCDATYADLESFYLRWLSAAGWVVIDPLPAARPSERIAPLPLPSHVRNRLARTTRVIAGTEEKP